MSRIKPLSEEQSSALEFQTRQAYEALEKAVLSERQLDAQWAEKIYEMLGTTLNLIAVSNVKRANFMEWSRETKESGMFNSYILQYALGHYPSTDLSSIAALKNAGGKPEPRKTTTDYAALKRAIDDGKTSYSTIERLAGDLSASHNFLSVIDAIKYVREQY